MTPLPSGEVPLRQSDAGIRRSIGVVSRSAPLEVLRAPSSRAPMAVACVRGQRSASEQRKASSNQAGRRSGR
ncbi:hypothetical protein ABZ860_21920 [Microbispora sp. NPDC046973]|uniref:hypothetical protein n=1 Tax=Microbispora sp. NPDC046973 TaxID=3155022 RepID=UPI0033FC01C9